MVVYTFYKNIDRHLAPADFVKTHTIGVPIRRETMRSLIKHTHHFITLIPRCYKILMMKKTFFRRQYHVLKSSV